MGTSKRLLGDCWCEIFTGRMPFLSPSLQRQSTKGMLMFMKHYSMF